MSIREALRELEMWGAGCTFSFTAYSDSAQKEMNIIRDWKELINQVYVHAGMYVHCRYTLIHTYCHTHTDTHILIHAY